MLQKSKHVIIVEVFYLVMIKISKWDPKIHYEYFVMCFHEIGLGLRSDRPIRHYTHKHTHYT